MAAESAPSSWCSVSVWREGQREVVVSVDPGTTLGALLERVLPAHGVPAPVAAGSAWSATSPVVPYDGSSCGEARALLPAQAETTLERLGWFPSGVLELRAPGGDGAETRSSKSSSVKASSYFEAVARRHDDWDALDGKDRVRVVKSGPSVEAKTSAAFAKIDEARAKASSKASATVWQMLAKRHALGVASIRPEDRIHVILQDREPAVYHFFGRAQAVSKAVDALRRHAQGDVLVARGVQLPMTPSFADLERRGLIADFELVTLAAREVGASASAPAPPPPTATAASESSEAPTPPSSSDLPPSSSEPSSSRLPLAVKFDGRTIDLPGLDPDVSTVADLQRAIADATGLAADQQKLVCKGANALTVPDKRLRDTPLVPNTTILLMRAPKKRR